MSRWLRRLLREDLAEELSPDASPEGILEEREEAPEALPDLPPTADLRLVVEARVPEASRADLSHRLAALQSVVRGVLTLAGLEVREVRVEAWPAETPDPARPSTWADLLDEEEDARDESAREESLQSPTGLWRALDLLQVGKGRGPTVGRRHSPAGGARHLRRYTYPCPADASPAWTPATPNSLTTTGASTCSDRPCTLPRIHSGTDR